MIKIAEDCMGVREINKVSSLLPLQQCPELRGENFLLGEGLDIGAAHEPRIPYRECDSTRAIKGDAFASRRFDLHVNWNRLILGLHGEGESRSDETQIVMRMPHPRLQNGAQPIKDRAKLPAGRSREVNVLRITQRFRKVQLVERGAAPETQLRAEEIVAEYLDQSTRHDEVLLDLSLLDPWDGASPGVEVHRRNHSSSCGLRCTMTFQRALRSITGFDLAR
jgi:hypothetical protein